MIKITFDKESEYQWIRMIVDCGALNLSEDRVSILKEIGVPTKQNVRYEKSDMFINDIEDNIKEYNRKITNKKPEVIDTDWGD